jgi:hypothetical protein
MSYEPGFSANTRYPQHGHVNKDEGVNGGPANALPFSGVGRYVMVDSSTAGAAGRPLLIY